MKKTSTKIVSPSKIVVNENSFPIVAIGSSAGGMEAMIELLKYLPADTGMAFIYVQHLSPDYKSMLSEILSKKTSMKVHEIDEMDEIKPNNIFVIPHNKAIEVIDGHIKLIPRSESGVAISIDILFSSLAHAQKERVIGIVLSGSGSDGTVGMRDIKHEGGLTFAQDDTAKFTLMPHSAIAAGVVDFILSPKEIALELAQLSKHPLIKTIGVKNGEEDLIDNGNPDLKTILNHLHKATGVDFSAYKMNTIKRRIIRRMLLYKISALNEYAKMLSQKKEEIDILYQDLLINVTSFFRDADTHKYLKENLFPKLLKTKKSGEPLRIWVPACATGEEAYSIAMMLLEIQESKTTYIPVQIFATDLSEKAIRKARIGSYTTQEMGTVSSKRIQRFFSKENGGFRINKAVRDICVFAPHNILQDPPFSRLDFISCCNLFIYLDNSSQKKAVNTFHYSLNDDGFLMLGKSENITQSANLFTGFNKLYKIFSRKKNSGIRLLPALLPRYTQQPIPEENQLVTNKNKTKQNIFVNHNGLDNAIDAILVSEFMPASVVINHQMEIVQFRGKTELFLTHPQGRATFNILKMARPEIAFELRSAISKVIKSNIRMHKSGIELKINAVVRSISFEVVPLNIEGNEPLLLILFTEQQHSEIYSMVPLEGSGALSSKDRRIKKLEQELVEAHLNALAFAQDQEAFTEELQSANEEIVSSNEELQTVNEELGTSKEETESANEELIVTNQELQTRINLLNQSYDYSEAIIATMHDAMVVLDKNLRVKSASKKFYKNFKVTEEETEGVLLYDLGNRQWNIPRLREILEDILPKNTHFHDFEITHNFPFIGEKIMLLNASRIVHTNSREELIVLAFADVTEVRKLALAESLKEKEALELQIETHKKIEEAYKVANANVSRLFLEAPAIICVHRGPEHVFELSNKVHQQVLGNRDIIGKPVREAMPDLEGSGIYELLDRVYSTGEPFVGNEYPVQIDRGNGKLEDAYFNFVYQAIRNSEEEIDGLLVHGVEVTEQILACKKFEESEKRYNMMLMQSPFAFALLKGKDMVVAMANDSVKQMWGKGDEIEGKPLIEILPEIKDQEFPALLHKVYTTGIPYIANEALARVKRKGKMEDVYFNFVYQPYRETDDSISGVTIIAIEVTEQVEARKIIEESEQRFRLALAGSTQIVFSQDKNLKHTWIYNAHPDFKPEDIVGKSDNELHVPATARILTDIKQKTLNTGKAYNGEVEIELGGQVVNYAMHIEPIKDAAENVTGIIGTVMDITERIKTHKKIKESEEKYRTLFTSIDQGYTLCELIRNNEGKGIDFYMLEVNPTYEEQTGVSKEMVLGKKILEVFPSLDIWLETYAAVVDNQCLVVFEHYFENTDRWFAIKAYPVGQDRFTVLFSDITERKQAEEKLIESESRFRTMADSSPVLIWTLEANGLSSYYNNTFLDFLGVSKEEDISDWEKIVHPDDVKSTFETINKSIAERSSFSLECRLLRADGQWRWVLAQGNPRMGANNEFLGFVGSSVDITERKQAEEKISLRSAEFEKAVKERTKELAEQREFSETILNTTVDLIGVYDKQMRIIGFNKASEDFFRIKKEDIIGKVHTDVFPASKGGQFEKDLLRALNGETIHNAIYHSADTGKYYENFLTPLKDTTGEVYAAVAIAHDITESISAIEKIKQSEEKFNKLFNVSPISKTLIDATSGKIVMVNDAFTNVFGYSREEALNKDGIELGMMDPVIRETLINELKTNGKSQNREIEFIKKSGEKFFTLTSTEIIEIGDKQFFLAVYNDISERKKAEKDIEQKNTELLNINKELEAFNYVSSHDLQAPLRRINIFADRILDKEVDNLSDDGKYYFRLMQHAAQRMQTLIQELLAFSKLSIADREFETTDLNIIIEEAKSDFKDVIAEKHAVITLKEICDVKIIPFQFRQLMHNLIGNALKFSKPDTAPHIIIKCEMLKSHPNFDGREACYITITDNGIGFDKEFAEKIFEVFQRLHGQEEYVGTGIGLAIVKKIVENHNGIITATSELTKGTTFHIYIPA